MKQYFPFIVIGIILFFGINFITKNLQSSATTVNYEPDGNVAVVVDAEGSHDTVINFTWRNANGKEYSLADYKGSVVLINFWATWCVPCRKEIPELIEINTELGDEEFVMLGISVDEGNDAVQKVNDFILQQKINYVNILDDGRMSRLFGSISAIPTTILIGRDGKVAETIVGLRTKEQFMEKIASLL